MIEPVLTKEGQKILDEMINKRPPIMRKSRNEKYLRSLRLLMNERGLKQADRELAIEAVKMVESKGIEPTFMMWEDPDLRPWHQSTSRVTTPPFRQP